MEFWEDLGEVEHRAEVVLSPGPDEKAPAKDAEERLDQEVDGIYRRNLKILDDVAHFREVDPSLGADQPLPSQWVDELGQEEAERRMRIALSGWVSERHAPVAFKLAANVVTGIMKTRAMRSQQGKQPLLVALVSMPEPQLIGEAPTKAFPRQKVDDDE